jgi:hypothetical protein
MVEAMQNATGVKKVAPPKPPAPKETTPEASAKAGTKD